jgi:tetratricopeptide (TPR) repeat protein
MPRTLNFRFVIGCFVVVAVVLTALHFTHRWQVQKQTGAFLRQADSARESGDIESEKLYLERYLASQPEDLDARERLARLLAKIANSLRDCEYAYTALEDVLRRDPSRAELRRFVAEYALKLNEFRSAKEHFTELLKRNPNDAESESRYAWILFLEKEYREAADWYRKAYTHQPDRIDAYVEHARLLRQYLSEPAAADQVIQLMVERNRSVRKAHITEAHYRLLYGNPQQVESALAEAKKLGPEELDVLVLSVEVAEEAIKQARQAGDGSTVQAKRAEIRATVDRGLKVHAKSVELYVKRAQWEETAEKAMAVIQSGLEAVPGDLTLLAALFDHQFRAGQTAIAATFKEMEKAGLSPAQLAYHEALVNMVQGDWAVAARKLEQVRSTAAPVLARTASLHLGRCYMQMGDADRRLQAYFRAVSEDMNEASWVPALMGLAEAYSANGRPEDALKTYQKLADSNRAPQAWFMVARLRMFRELQNPDPMRRDWKLAEDAVERVARIFPQETETRLLRAKLHALRGQFDEARKIRNELFAERKMEPAVWIAHAEQVAHDRTPTEAIQVLADGRKQLSDPPALRSEQIRYLVSSKEPNAVTKLEELAEGIDQYPVPVRVELLREITDAATVMGASDLTNRMIDRILAIRPNDLPTLQLRFDQRLNGTDAAALEQLLAEIRQANGEEGPTTRFCRARYLLWKAHRKDDRSGLREAFGLLEGLEAERAGDARLSRGKAYIAELEGRTDAALTYYQQAVQRGDTDLQVIRKLSTLLDQKGRHAEAQEVLAKLNETARSDSNILRLMAELSLKGNDRNQALVQAAKAVSEDSTNVADLTWLARMRRSAGDQAGAERAYRKATSLKPEDSDGWLLWMEYLIATNRKSEADTAMEEAKTKVRPEAVPLMIARYNALTGDHVQARAAFEKARQERPTDLKVLQAEADYLTASQQWALARDAWDRVIKLVGASVEDKQFAAQMLAVCLAIDPDYAVSQRALEVLKQHGIDTSTSSVANTPSQRWARAVVLSLQKDRASKLAAIKTLEEDRASLTPRGRFLLAQLYSQVGNPASFRVTMIELLQAASHNPLYVAHFAGWLLDQNDYQEAEKWVTKLETLQPNSLWAVELRVRLLAARKDLAGARAALKAWENRPTPPYGLLAAVAELVGLYPEAERYLKLVVDANQTKLPEVVLELAKYYARRGRMKEAIDELDKAWKSCPPAAVGQACVVVLSVAPPGDRSAVKRVAEWLDTARSNNTAWPSLLHQLAYVRNVEGRYTDAIAIYRQLTNVPNPHPLDLNNLAYLLSAHQGQHEEALMLLERAKRAIGPVSDLLDTEAQVRIARGTKDDLVIARRLLQDVIAMAPSGVAHFHVAQLEQKAGNKIEATVAWVEAERKKLTTADLHPLEWAAFHEMATRQK